MNDTLIICLTTLLGLAVLAGTWIYTRVYALREMHDSLERRSLLDQQIAGENAGLAEKSKALTLTLHNALKEYNDGHEQTSRAVLALSERVAIMEAAMKTAIAQMVAATDYSLEKHKELKAKIVREPGMRPRG